MPRTFVAAAVAFAAAVCSADAKVPKSACRDLPPALQVYVTSIEKVLKATQALEAQQIVQIAEGEMLETARRLEADRLEFVEAAKRLIASGQDMTYALQVCARD